MSSDVEIAYSTEKERRIEYQDLALVAGITALHTVVAPIVVLGGVAKSISKGINEKIRSKLAFIDNINYTTTSVTHQTIVKLPNQLLGDHVDVIRQEEPLVSEARRF